VQKHVNINLGVTFFVEVHCTHCLVLAEAEFVRFQAVAARE